MNYDYIIIGGGPTGLTLAYTLGSLKKRCLLIDDNESLGGCHRVTRVKVDEKDVGLFTEHGPRIYSSTYINLKMLLDRMGSDFYTLFTPYNFSIGTISGKTLDHFNFREMMILALEFFKMLFGFDHSKFISVEAFANKHKFSADAKDYLDRICRLTDGAGSDRYTLYEFLSLANQNYFYKLYQPKFPNDISLFKIWEKAILNTGYVDILKNKRVDKIIIDGYNTIKSVIVDNEQITGNNFLFCLPPLPFQKILNNSNPLILDSYPNFNNFVENNTYVNDIPISFHWKKKLNLPKVWGFPKTDWGVAFIVLTDYMNTKDPRNKTLISTCITMVDKKSEYTGKTANETSNPDELIEEVFRQLKLSYPDLQNPDYSILNPKVIREKGKWIELDTAYVETFHQQFIKAQNDTFKNLYFVGTQNGNTLYNFTSMESAVSNGLSLLYQLHPESKKIYPFKGPVTLIKVIRIIILMIVIIILLYFIIKKIKKNKDDEQRNK